MMPPVSIVLAEDHQLVREGIRLVLERQGDLAVIGETADGLKVADLVERLAPDLLVLDLMLPGLGGLDVTREVRRRSPRVRIVILSTHSSEGLVLQALRNGASAYVLKDASGAELAQAIREAMAGRRYLSPPLTEKAIAAYVERVGSAEADLYETLTPREREVLHLAAEGLGNVGIGERLAISPRTAEKHRAHVLRKLGLRSTADLIVYGVTRGLVPGGTRGPLPGPSRDDDREKG